VKPVMLAGSVLQKTLAVSEPYLRYKGRCDI
jgi:hypothetical protein